MPPPLGLLLRFAAVQRWTRGESNRPMFHNPERGENSFKVVFDGSPVSFKTRIVTDLFHGLRADYRGELTEVAEPFEPLVMCDFALHAGVTIGGHPARLWMMSLPAWHMAEKRELARGFDAAVVVADDDHDPEAVAEAWEKSHRTLPISDSFEGASRRGLVLPHDTPAELEAVLRVMQVREQPPPFAIRRLGADGDARAVLAAIVAALRDRHGA